MTFSCAIPLVGLPFTDRSSSPCCSKCATSLFTREITCARFPDGPREEREEIEKGKEKEDEKIIPKDANCKKMQLLVWIPQRSAWNLPMLKPNVPPAHVLPSLTVRVSVKDIIQCGREGGGGGSFTIYQMVRSPPVPWFRNKIRLGDGRIAMITQSTFCYAVPTRMHSTFVDSGR